MGERGKPHNEDDVLELVCIRSPQLGRRIDRLDGDSDWVTFSDSVRKGTDGHGVRIMPRAYVPN